MALRSWMLGLSLVAACGPDGREAPELDRVCGAEGPYRVLALDGDTTVASPELRRVDDRIYAIVGAVPEADQLQPDATTVWSFGPCGESPRIVAHDLFSLSELEQWPGVVLGRTGSRTGDLVVIDPEGVAPPRTIVRDVDLLDPRTDVGILATLPRDHSRDEPHTLRLSPYPDAPDGELRAPETLLDDVVVGSVEAVDSDAFALTLAGDVVAIDLASRQVETVWSGASSFDLSLDGRWLVVTEVAGPGLPRSVYLLDRDEGTETLLGEVTHELIDAKLSFDDGVELPQDPSTGLQQRFAVLPSLEIVDVPVGLGLRRDTSDGRWLAQDKDGWVLWDAATGEVDPLFEGGGSFSSMGSDRLEVLQVELTVGTHPQRQEGELWQAEYDAGEPELLAHRATTTYVRLEDGRVVTTLGFDGGDVGELAVIDPDTLDELVIDDHVRMRLPTQYDPEVFGDADLLAYAVLDGDESGIWLARVRPE